jgi:uncharacterized delta-60 repeat protein
MSYGGSLDLKFGSGGFADIQAPADSSFFPEGSAIQADGKLVVAGVQESFGTTSAEKLSFSVTRFNIDGSVDTTFGDRGFLAPAEGLTDLESLEDVYIDGPFGVAIQPDGKIVAVGDVGTDALMVRLTADGALDSSFGADGIVTLGNSSDQFEGLFVADSVAIRSDGEIAVLGRTDATPKGGESAVEVFEPNGSVDPSFNSGLPAIIPTPGSNVNYDSAGQDGLVALANGDVVAISDTFDGPGTPNIIQVTAFDTLGALDQSFGSDGQATIPASLLFPSGASANPSVLALQSDGKLVVGGSMTYANESPAGSVTFALRLDVNGSLDPSFGIGGVDILAETTPPGTSPGAIAIQSDGKIVLADGFHLIFERLDGDGLPDLTFGTGGTSRVQTSSGGFDFPVGSIGVAITPSGKILAASAYGSFGTLFRLLGSGSNSDYDGDGRADPAVYFGAPAVFADVASGGVTAPIVQFGTPGLGNSIPAPGAYFGEGQDDMAVYLTGPGAFAIRSPDGNQSKIVPFGIPGAGNSLPAPGDYDRSGKTEVGVYLPSLGEYVYRPAAGGPDVVTKIGIAGAGQSIPAPGDYFGTGQDDIAVYEPATASFVIRDPVTGLDLTIPFGTPGAGRSIPVPGDYDGSGRADLAVYLPASGDLIYRPAGGGVPDVIVPIGRPGIAQSLPEVGDFDRSGRDEAAVYEPGSGTFAYQPASGGPVVSIPLGTPGQTVAFSTGTDAVAEEGIGAGPDPSGAGASPAVPAAWVPLTPDVLDPVGGIARKREPGPLLCT